MERDFQRVRRQTGADVHPRLTINRRLALILTEEGEQRSQNLVIARILITLVVIAAGSAALILYARIVEPGDWPLLSLARHSSTRLDPASLIIGAGLGYLLAVLLRYPWAELPERVLRWLNRFVPVVQFATCAAVCLAVLIYW